MLRESIPYLEAGQGGHAAGTTANNPIDVRGGLCYYA